MTTIAEILSVASNSVGAAHRDASGWGYYAYVPFRDDQPHGPSTEVRSTCRFSMLERLRSHKAAIALSLAEEEFEIDSAAWHEDVDTLLYRIVGSAPGIYQVSDWRKEVRALIRKHRTIN